MALSRMMKYRLHDPKSGKEPLRVKVYIHIYHWGVQAYTIKAAADHYRDWYSTKPVIETETEILLDEYEGNEQ